MGLVYLARHGTTAWNREERYQGQRDVPLCAEGRAEAERLARRLAGIRFDAIWSSDLSRARETAEIVWRSLEQPVPVRFVPELREMAFGAWEGLTLAEVAARYPDALEAYRSDPLDGAPPGGESTRMLAERARRAFDGLWREGLGRVLVVAHGAVLKALILSLLGADLALRRRLVLDPASLSILRYADGVARLVKLNDTCHLRGAGREPVRAAPAAGEDGQRD